MSTDAHITRELRFLMIDSRELSVNLSGGASSSTNNYTILSGESTMHYYVSCNGVE